MKSIGRRMILVMVNIYFIYQFSIGNEVDSSFRKKININREWKFQLGDFRGAEKKEFNDHSWQDIGLPHSFSIPYFLSSEFYSGYGWYRKHLMIDKEALKRTFSLEFEGVFQVAEIYVNGIPAGNHHGGYNGFSLDITSYLKLGDNVIAVRVNNLWSAQLAPRAGEHVFSGGIYRDVWLIETAPIHVTWYGTFVTTPGLSEKSGKVNVNTEIINQGRKSIKGTLRTLILDPGGNLVTHMDSKVLFEPGKTINMDQTSQIITNPRLWTPASPYLYKAITEIVVDNKTIDHYETSFGMRWMEWTPDHGFFLNGMHYYFKGVNVHQDHAGWGDAVTNAGFQRDIHLMKEAGFDFIRGSHYPHDPSFSDACDSIGMLFWSENCFWGIGGFKPEGDWTCSAYPSEKKDEKPFEESVKQSLNEMIRIHRNHPSIIVWSMSNEPFFSVPEQMPKVREFLKELVKLSHELDPTRAAAIGGCQRGEIDKLGDVAGYNGDGAKLFLNPGVANVVSEYGSTVTDRPGEYFAGYGELQEEQFVWRSGQAIWCGFDHGSIAGHFGCMGLVDYFRIPKRQWYWYRKNLNGKEPEKWPIDGIPAKICLTTDKNTIEHADGTDDVQLTVTIQDKDGLSITCSPDVSLEIVSGPGEFPTGSSITFQKNSDINIRDGKAAIEFRSYEAGKTLIRATSPGLIPSEITIDSKNAPGFNILKYRKTSLSYTRYKNNLDLKKYESINLLAERPSKASSSQIEHPQNFANDLDSSSYWQPSVNDILFPWWQVDMENIYSLSKVKIIFNENQIMKFQIEISMDGLSWNQLVESDNELRTYEFSFKPENRGRFLRVSFLKSESFHSMQPQITKIEAYGIHTD